VARRTPPRWHSGVISLYGDFCGWAFQHDLVPPTREQFKSLLMEACIPICMIHGEEFVGNIALKDDLAAHKEFQKRTPSPAKRRRSARRQT
jgi:hypothetical protein